MAFNTGSFAIFLLVVCLAFYIAKNRYHWLVLLSASYWFYASYKAKHLIALLLAVTVISYGLGILMERTDDKGRRRAILCIGTALCVLCLASIKYLKSILLAIGVQIEAVHPNIFITIGLSYFTFQAISYLVDIYLELEKSERHFGYFALYLAFFPKLLQGPIERAGDLLPQLKAKYEFNYDNIRYGLLLFTVGLFKKFVIADRLSAYVDFVYNDVTSFAGLPLWIATYAYAFQIYMDFSGYTDMALGIAMLFNIRLTENFNSPYLAVSVADFWRRWHITFSRWILDYIFKPLQMHWRDWKNWGTAVALVVTFLVSGLWHGPTWGFVIWGLLHGGYMACAVFYRPYQKKIHKKMKVEKTRVLKIWQVFVTFNLVSLAWVFFRANNLHDALYVITNLLVEGKGSFSAIIVSQGNYNLSVMGICFLAMLAISIKSLTINKLFKSSAGLRWSMYYILIISILTFGNFGKSNFLYFNY